MGAEGCILCYILYAWALSYGVDESGQLDVPEGGAVPIEVYEMRHVGKSEMRREADRQRRKSKMLGVLDVILKRIDELAIMRKPTWDGVRCLLLVLPLTEGAALLSCLLPCRYLICVRGLLNGGTAGNVRDCDQPSLHALLVRCDWLRWSASRSICRQR